MAHITKIKIDGLMGRSSPVEFEFNRHTNIFFGENGCGKTTLLKILDAALSLDALAASALPFKRAEISIYSINERTTIKHVWEQTGTPEDKRLKELVALRARDQHIFESFGSDSPAALFEAFQKVSSKKSWKTIPKPKSEVGKWAHTFLPTNRLYSGELIQRTSRLQLSDSELDRLFSESVSNSWLQFYSTTLSSVRSIQESGLTRILEEMLASERDKRSDQTQIEPAAAYHKVQSFLARQGRPGDIGTSAKFNERYKKNVDLQRVVANIDEIERAIERTVAPVEQFLNTITSLFSRNKKLQLEGNRLQVALESGELLPISGLSSGEKHLVKILLTVIAAGPNAVIIDEPELSLHIDWQRVFVRTLRSINPDCQLILASHSPEIMAEVADESIFKL